jgi:cobalt/nickel transport system ATP-binding protein
LIAPAIELCAVAHDYADGTLALRGVDLRILPGEAVAIVGANGAGKSTLLQHINGLLRPGHGSVSVEGIALSRASLPEVRRRVGYVFQDADDQLFMPTVQDDVAFGPINQGLPPTEVNARVLAALQAVDAAHLATRATYRLSGGEKRAVAIAGVLAMAPSILVLDEPSSGLDPTGRRRLIELLCSFTQTRVIATHDLDLVLDCCQRVVVLHEGRVHADGAPRQLLADTALLRRCRLEPPLSGGVSSKCGFATLLEPPPGGGPGGPGPGGTQ